MKLAVITCYFDPDYVRARTLRSALKTNPSVTVVVAKNKNKGLLRYPEMIWRIWKLRLEHKPDAYLLTFRGQEMLPYVLLIAGKKPVIFDEFIVPVAYANAEKHKLSFSIMVKHSLARVSEPLYRMWLRHCAFILADTQAHAELSARTSNMNLRKYIAVPVGTDEKLFTVEPKTDVASSSHFEVFYYGNMLPLHGLDIVLAAAIALKDKSDISFHIVGGKTPMRRAVLNAIDQGANISYEKWLPFKQLSAAMHKSSLCLGGPFGNTQQANHVITGKTYQILACGVPVVVGASHATDEYFIDKQNALVIQQANPEALAKAISWAAGHPAELQDIASNGRKLFEKEFSITAIARRLEPAVESIS